MNETTPSPLNNVITIDDERIKNHLDRVVRGSVEETLNAPPGMWTAVQCAALRAQRGATRHPDWLLRVQSADQGGRGSAEGPEATATNLRDGRH
jgi:hypothetical protein